MDKTEIYIKMRLAAIPDLGKGSHPTGGERIIDYNVTVDSMGDFYAYTEECPHWCQLERQDQLQEMIFPNHEDRAITMTMELAKFAGRIPKIKFPIDIYGRTYRGKSYAKISMEQLWLAFVMKELHSKIWDGDNWIKAGSTQA